MLCFTFKCTFIRVGTEKPWDKALRWTAMKIDASLFQCSALGTVWGCGATAADFALAAWIHTNLTQRSASWECIRVCPDMSNVQGTHDWISLNHLSGHRNSSRETSENGSVDRTIQNRCTPNCHKFYRTQGTNLHPYGIVGLDCLDPQLRSIRHTTRPSSTMTIYCVYNLFLLHSSAMIIYNY